MLTWAPPSGWENYTVLNVGAGGDFTLPNSVDYKIVGASTTTRINLTGGRNIVIFGSNVNVDAPYGDPTSTDNTGIKIGGSSTVIGRIIHIEGVEIGGASLGDGIQAADGNAILQVENVHVVKTHGSESGVHADCIQPWGGVLELRIDRFSCYTQYQGGMWKRDLPSGSRNGPIHLRNVNVRDADGLSQYLSWLSGPKNERFYIDDDSFYMQGAAGRNFGAEVIWDATSDGTVSNRPVISSDGLGNYATYPNLLSPLGGLLVQNFTGGLGKLREGVPPGGDYVLPANVGVGYVSPGYQ